jgi:GMP synthase-like glutamine amidotransferase
MTKCLIVQHLAVESAYAIEDSLVGAGITVDTRLVHEGAPLPADASGLDALVVMGGPMSAGSDVGFPTRPSELKLLSDAVRAGTPTLGVCLGAQLLAVAAGGSVFRGVGGLEIGWGAVSLEPACADDPLFAGLVDELTVLHWHGDTFDLPPGGHLLMSNTSYVNQAFRVGKVAWGVQFHLEVTEAAVEGFLNSFPQEATMSGGGAERIRADTPGALAKLGGTRDLVFARFANLVTARAIRADRA